LHSDEWQIEPTVAVVWPDRCVSAEGKACGICARVCPYGAVDYTQGKAAEIITAKCHGCGACVGDCPHDAITQLHYTDAEILAQIRTLLATEPEKKILALRCHWCSYGGADLAGTSHFEYSANERGIKVMCSARMDADFIYEAYRLGAGGILYSGCHQQDCHYITGQVVGAKRAARLKTIFDRMGMTNGRFRIEWISAAEGDKYARVINEMQATLDAIAPEDLHAEVERLRPEMAKRLGRLTNIPDVGKALEQTDDFVQIMTNLSLEKVA
jgi:heterodisulfide reductase subunit A